VRDREEQLHDLHDAIVEAVVRQADLLDEGVAVADDARDARRDGAEQGQRRGGVEGVLRIELEKEPLRGVRVEERVRDARLAPALAAREDGELTLEEALLQRGLLRGVERGVEDDRAGGRRSRGR
jgi:hypothetical protein